MRESIYSGAFTSNYDFDKSTSYSDKTTSRSKRFGRKYILPVLAATLCAGTSVYAAGDGTDEPGFVAPPRDPKLPPAPPRTASSAETFIPGGCTTPMSRTESKKPPKPPTLITKLKS